MIGKVPARPQIYHILHVDRLSSVISDRFLWCDEEIQSRQPTGTTIGMKSIKQNRLLQRRLNTHPDLFVGQCVPFYFCPRSVMLYVIDKQNHEGLEYRGGQEPIVHLEADLFSTIDWAKGNNQRWAFTLSNAGSKYFEDRNDLSQLDQLNWDAIEAHNWKGEYMDLKCAEFLVENSFPWELVSRIGVFSIKYQHRVKDELTKTAHKPVVEVKRDWYY